MPALFGDATPSKFYFGDNAPSKLYFGDNLIWTSFTEYTIFIATPGAYSVPIPDGCRFIDIILIGGGGGGGASAASRGSGGYAGEWQSTTLERGVDIPNAITAITGTVGAGGSGGSGSAASGGNGVPTTALVSGWWSGITAAGGAGGPGNSTARQQAGFDAGNHQYNGIWYVGGNGGPTTAGTGQPGYEPGGGGAGGSFAVFDWRGGGAGARGQAWFRFY